MGRGTYGVTDYDRSVGGYKQKSPAPESSYDPKHHKEQALEELEEKICRKPEIDDEESIRWRSLR